MKREKMMWILLLVGLTSVSGMIFVKMTPTLYEAEEDNDIIIMWDIQTKADVSLANIACYFHSKTLKVFYRMMKGVEIPESQHQQFAGRVQCDRDALREGRVQLNVSRVTAEDSGDYTCDLAANYDETQQRWTLVASGKFVLTVSPTSEGDNGDEPRPTPQPKAEPDHGLEPPPRSPYMEYTFLAGLIGVQLVIVCAAVSTVLLYKASKQKDSDQDGRPGCERLTFQQRNEVNVHIPE
ncbi:uncharacterized protein [Trachinotus anak]|uniref:uncharacterized protein isoform X2 n=1 Tax=Trachinotus anak TaxID=443729 RepID=UPI0039F23C6C